MTSSSAAPPTRSAHAMARLLHCLLTSPVPPHRQRAALARALGDGLVAAAGGDGFALTEAGRAWLQRHQAVPGAGAIDPFRAQHLALTPRQIADAGEPAVVLVNDSESPLAWLARRGRIAPAQFLAGETLRADFTRGQLTPRITSDWSMPSGRGGNGPGEISDSAMAARQRVRHALEGVGPEFAGLLLDVCCFLRGLEDVERERKWPARSAKVVLQLALDRLARHYGVAAGRRGGAAAAPS